MTIYFEEAYDPAMDDTIQAIDIFDEITALHVHMSLFSSEALKQFNLNRHRLIERREYLKVIKEYGDGINVT